MRDYLAHEIRNIVFLGHGQSGKTTLLDSIAFYQNKTERLGDSASGSSISDFDAEEIKRGQSIYTSIIPVEYNNYKVNLIDTPGYIDFIGEQEAALQIADNAVIVVSANEDLEPGVKRAYRQTEALNLPTIFFINKLDSEKADFDNVYQQLRNEFGKSVILFEVPIIDGRKVIGSVNILRNKAWYYDNKDEAQPVPEHMQELVASYYDELAESVAMSDDDLMEKFFSGERFSEEEIALGLCKGVRDGSIRPVYCGSALEQTGIKRLMDLITEYFPTYEERKEVIAYDRAGEMVEVQTNENEKFSAFVFKTVVDPFVGRISFIKVMSGILTSDSEIYNVNKQANEKISSVFALDGKYQVAVGKLFTGDIGALVKLSETMTNDTLASKDFQVTYPAIEFTQPMLGVAIFPKTKDDEDKLSAGLQRVVEENPTLKVVRNSETKETVLYGVGDQIIDITINKMLDRYRVAVNKQAPKVQYRETIKKGVLAEGKHKKQSGGSGQYGHVFIQFEPTDTEEITFNETVFGGAVPRQYFSAVEDGVREAMLEGVLGGYKMVNVNATLTDGSYHDVDSKDIAFKMAAKIAYREGIPKANPVLLEPIVDIEVHVPEEYTGVIVGDLNKRRGIVSGMDYDQYNDQIIRAEVPFNEILTYTSELRSMSKGNGTYTYTEKEYREVPVHLTDSLLA
ncbi:MAG: elongation factor G [Erysipelothrix sp.]|nr:elongation factor G [Erysipelothrix sp.]